jgi:oligopeptide/dipeptide ABC transporter ATP-binding protein
LALNPELIVADEPVSALDVSIQAQIINLLDSLKQNFGLSYLIIGHDLAVVEHICDRVIVMYLGNLVEMADVKNLYQNPQHPYTQSLLSSVPVAAPGAKERRKKRQLLKGDVPSPIDPPSGCRFHTRCAKAMNQCKEIEPTLVKTNSDHFVACLLYS